MTRILVLTRHAKSSWGNPMLDDHDRPLNKRGRVSAKAVGTWLAEKGWTPDEVLSSTSLRTYETWRQMELDTSEVTFTRDLYHPDPGQIFRTLTSAKGSVILVLSHNPGIAEFAGRIVRQPPDHMRFFDYPTCATTIIQFDVEKWSDVSWKTGEVLDFVIPRELSK